jgi:hypothetical protein
MIEMAKRGAPLHLTRPAPLPVDLSVFRRVPFPHPRHCPLQFLLVTICIFALTFGQLLAFALVMYCS